MKLFYLTGSVILTVLILVLAFENIAAYCTALNFFFYEVDKNPTVVIMGIAVLGVITGVFYHAFISRVLSTSPEEEEQQF
ncbi:MAG: hypothetical protein AAB953_00210 [Patescibacteria group bacterium]